MLIIGHSFIKRLKKHLRRKAKNKHLNNFVHALNLHHIRIGNSIVQVDEVILEGRSGLKISEAKDLRWVEDQVRAHRPDITYEDIGTNDLTSDRSDPEGISYTRVRQKYREFRASVHNIRNVSKVVVASNIIARPKLNGEKLKAFNNRRKLYNAMLKELEREDQHFLAHKHRYTSLRSLRADISQDGIHPDTPKGLKQYTTSIKDAIVLAMRRMVRLGYL